jgi:hypothetical protein
VPADAAHEPAQMASDLLTPLLDEHPSYWKWITLAAHSALQGANGLCVRGRHRDIGTGRVLEQVLACLHADIDARREAPEENLNSGSGNPLGRQLRRVRQLDLLPRW